MLNYNGVTDQVSGISTVVVLSNAPGVDSIDLSGFSGTTSINLTQPNANTTVRGGSGLNLIDGAAGVTNVLPSLGTDRLSGNAAFVTGVAAGYQTPAQLATTAGALSVLLVPAANGQQSLEVFGPTGAGFSIVGNWSDVSTTSGQTFGVSGPVTLQTGLGGLPLTIPSFAPLTFQVGSNFVPGYGQVTSFGWDSGPSLSTADPASPLHFLSTQYGLSLQTPSASWGLALGRDVPNAANLPVDPAVPYFYFTVNTGFSAGFGTASVSAGGGQSLTVLFDPGDPSLYVQTTLPANFGVGVSAKGYIPFNPTQPLPGNPLLTGNLIASGSFSLGEIPVTLGGTAVVNFDVNHTGSVAGLTPTLVAQLLGDQVPLSQLAGQLGSTLLTDVAVGINGTAGVGYELGGLNFALTTAAGSAVYLPGTNVSNGVFSFAAGSLNFLANTPLSFFNTGTEQVAGTVRTDGAFDVTFKAGLGGLLGTLVPNLATVEVTNSGITLAAQTRDVLGLGGASVRGNIDSQGNFSLTGQTAVQQVGLSVAGVQLFSVGASANLTVVETGGQVSASADLTIGPFTLGNPSLLNFTGELTGKAFITAGGGGLQFSAGGTVSGQINNIPFVGSRSVSASWSLVGNQITVSLGNGIPTFTLTLPFAAFPQRTITPEARVGQEVTLSGRISNPDPGSPFFLVVNWGDGTPTQTFEFPASMNGQEVEVHHRYREPSPSGRPYEVQVSWHDREGRGAADVLHVTVTPRHHGEDDWDDGSLAEMLEHRDRR